MTTTPGEPPYTAGFLAEQRARLQRERDAVSTAMSGHQEEMIDWSHHDDVGVDQHMADDATALTEQELGVSLIDNARYILAEIDDAIRRIDDRTYGWDEESGCWIREERLQALPWARREIEGQRRLEDRLKDSGGREMYTHDDEFTSL